MATVLGPKTHRIYTTLRERILSGDLPAGTKLPPHTELAIEFHVAPMTVRQVLGRLETEGLLSLEAGRGTFVRRPMPPAVLVVDDDALSRLVIAEHVTQAGFRAIEADGPRMAQAALDREPDIALVLSDVRMPEAADGVQFIRRLRRQRPDLPVAAVTGHPDDLTDLLGTAECPVLVLSKPTRPSQIAELFRLALGVRRAS